MGRVRVRVRVMVMGMGGGGVPFGSVVATTGNQHHMVLSDTKLEWLGGLPPHSRACLLRTLVRIRNDFIPMLGLLGRQHQIRMLYLPKQMCRKNVVHAPSDCLTKVLFFVVLHFQRMSNVRGLFVAILLQVLPCRCREALYEIRSPQQGLEPLVQVRVGA
jgi:hypothetical protein